MTDPQNKEQRMSPTRSASTKSYVSNRERRRARRKKRNKNGPLAALAVLLLLAALVIGMICWQNYQQYIHRFDGYPLRYTDVVTAASEEFDVEPAYLYAVILAESNFRPEAVSKVGALGLMQIMPETGEWLAGKLDMRSWYTEKMLTDPETNVRMGAWYLHYLLQRYDGDKRCASAAYHAGQGTVDRWLKDPNLSEDGKTLTAIAYDSTDSYVSKVLKNYAKYTELLSQDP